MSPSNNIIVIPDVMRAIVVREHGGPDNLLYEKGYNVPKELSEGEILVHNQYAGTSLHYSYFFLVTVVFINYY
jgi:hypothetical protein